MAEVTQAPSIRQRIKSIERVLLPGNIPPETARQSLMTLTALLGPVLDEVRESERDYRHVLADKMTETKTKAAAEVQAMTTPAYDRYRLAQDIEKQMEQSMINCRRYLTSIDEEMKLQR